MRKRSILTACAFILVLFLLTGCFAINDAKTKLAESNALFDVDYNGEVIRDLRYGEAERNVYDLYLPEDISAPEADHLILFIHGGSDSFVVPENSEKMKEATAGYAELHVLPNVPHAMSVINEPEQYRKIVSAFLEKITDQ